MLAQNPPEPVRATVQRHLHAVRQRADRYTTVVTGYAEAGGRRDTDVNSATDAEQIDLFGVFPVEISDESREQSDDFARVAAGAELRRPLSPDTTFFLSGDLENIAHDEYDDFDTRLLRARSGAVFHRERGQTRVGLRLQRFDVGGEAYRELIGLDVNASWRWSPHVVLNGGLQVVQQTYDAQEIRDGTLVIASGGVTRIWDAPLRPVASFGVFVGREEPDDDSDNARAVAGRDMAGATTDLRLRLAPQWNVTARLQYRHSEHGAMHALTRKTREEDYYQADVSLHWQPDTHWRIGPRLRHSVKEANVNLHDYERTVFELHARYGF